MKKVETDRFQAKKPEEISFSGDPLLENPPKREGGGRGRKPIPTNKQSVRAYERTADTAVRTDNLLDLVPPAPDKRRPERYAFQFWEDQITRLKQLRKVLNLNKDADNREEVSLSDMIREAVDDYLAKQIKQLKQSVRTDE